jgi:hypothetical protein
MMSDISVTTISTTEVTVLAEGVSYDEENSDVRRMRNAGRAACGARCDD